MGKTNFQKYLDELDQNAFIQSMILNCDGCPAYPCDCDDCSGVECEDQLVKWCEEEYRQV